MASNRGWRPDWQKSTYLFFVRSCPSVDICGHFADCHAPRGARNGWRRFSAFFGGCAKARSVAAPVRAMRGIEGACRAGSANGSAHRTCINRRCADGRVAECHEWATRGGVPRTGNVSAYTVTAREAHLCGERGSPAVGKGIVCLQVGYAPQGGGKHRQAVLGG